MKGRSAMVGIWKWGNMTAREIYTGSNPGCRFFTSRLRAGPPKLSSPQKTFVSHAQLQLVERSLIQRSVRMATAAVSQTKHPERTGQRDRLFFSGIALLVLIAVLVGFARTYFLAGEIGRAHV